MGRGSPKLKVAGMLAMIVAAIAVTCWPAKAGNSTKVYFDTGGDRIVVDSGGVLRVASGGTLDVLAGGDVKNGAGAGAIVTKTGLSLVERGDGVSHKTTWSFSAVSLAITDATTAGAHGKIQLYDWPAGHIKILGSTCDLAVTCGATGLTATATYDFGLGSAGAGVDNAALASTEQDVITKIEGDLSSSAATLRSVNSTDLTLAGTSTAADLWLNAAFEADDASANETCTVTGTVTVHWLNLGDY